jgi:hypothetical protein
MSNVEIKIEGTLDFATPVRHEYIGDHVWIYIKEESKYPRYLALSVLPKFWEITSIGLPPTKNESHVEC